MSFFQRWYDMLGKVSRRSFTVGLFSSEIVVSYKTLFWAWLMVIGLG